jgi:2-polyprenyl-3-methyl-5-hydroxy-6-metoxy-1,4-benzoquinol methylase
MDKAGRSFWNERWATLPEFCPYEGPVFEQHPVIAPFVRAGSGKNAIEVGCVPGNFLVYLAKEFGYRVSGIDYSEMLEYTRANLKYHNVPVGDLYQADLFSFQSPIKYDLVFSSGFVEHFTDHLLVVQKHAELATPGGLVVIIVPNLTHIHRVLCSTFDRKNFEAHVLTLMDRKTLASTLQSAGLEVLHCDYQKTFRPVYPLPYPVSMACRAVQKVLRLSHLDSIGNRFGSPYLISISQKPALESI